MPAHVLGQLREAERSEYEIRIKALDDLIKQRVMEAQAKKEGLTPEKFLQRYVDSKIADPTPGEVEAFYLGQRDQRQNLEEIRSVLTQDLKRVRIQQARDSFLRSLERPSDLVVLLQRPKVQVKHDSARLKGSSTRPVIIVEFSDFSCPFCRQAESTMFGLSEKYQGKVSFAYRDYPLRDKHPQAELAAEASRCAAEQDKFWEYHDLLFENQPRLARADLLKNARDLKLDEKQFASCLDTGKYQTQIEEDIQDGIRLGVSGTPAFFINGVFLQGALPAVEFEKIIDEELRSANRESAHN